MIRPTLKEARELAPGNTVIPIALEILSDVRTSMEVLRNIKNRSNHYYLLESVVNKDNWSRYSFLGYDPTLTVHCTDGEVTVKSPTQETVTTDNPIEKLKEILAGYKSPRIDYLPPFTGGLVGYFSYDCIKYFEPSLNIEAKNPEEFRDYNFMLMDRVIAFDHFRQKIVLIVNIDAEDIETNYIAGTTILKDMERMILEPLQDPTNELIQQSGKFTPAFTEKGFSSIIKKVQQHIVEGDIFQAVVSNRFTAPFSGTLLQTYRVLRTINPSPYMVYFHFDDMEIACASPETLISVRNGIASSFPLAGTVPRGKNEEEDAVLIQELLTDEKELAEHDMLVDLARNDIGKIAEFGSVEVTEYREIKQFSHVSHIASKVIGRVKEAYGPLEALAAALPAGTLSGAPKVRACQIIDSLEGTKRGPYGGALGYIDFTGDMEMCIGIRMAVHKNNKVFVQSGAGIVADSVAEKEFQETQNKAKAIMAALKYEGK